MDRKEKVLVIDDDVHVRHMMEIKFRNRGYHVNTARNGEDAVITDINMPKLDGKSLCEQTNDLKKERPFLTIVMTARITHDEKQWINDMIDTELMEKPFSPAKYFLSAFGNPDQMALAIPCGMT